MNEVICNRIVWRRRNVRHHYVGRLLASRDRIRLVGHEPATGIDVALAIPFDEIERVRGSTAAEETVAGGHAVVLDLAGSDSIFVREVGVGEPHTGELADRIAALVVREPSLAAAPVTGGGRAMKVRDVMTIEVKSVTPDTPLKKVACILAEARISGLPVVNKENVPVGVVSEADILYKERAQPAGRVGLLGLLLEGDLVDAELKLQAKTAAEAMTAPALTISPNRPVAEAAARMLDEQVNRLPVVDEEGKLIGIVTRADLVKAFLRSDAEIAKEITDDVILRTLWMPPEQLAVTVENGEVTVTGQVETENDAALVEEFVRRVPGVVSVRTAVSWEVENGKRHRRSGRRRSHKS